MTQLALSDKESFPTTTVSNFPIDTSSPFVRTVSEVCDLAFHVDLASESPPVTPRNSSSLSSFVEDLEKDPAFAKDLSEARKALADQIEAIDPNGIRKMRMKHGWSQAKLAAEIGTTQGHIARIEGGKTDMRLGTLTRIAKALGEKPEVVFLAILANSPVQS